MGGPPLGVSCLPTLRATSSTPSCKQDPSRDPAATLRRITMGLANELGVARPTKPTVTFLYSRHPRARAVVSVHCPFARHRVRYRISGSTLLRVFERLRCPCAFPLPHPPPSALPKCATFAILHPFGPPLCGRHPVPRYDWLTGVMGTIRAAGLSAMRRERCWFGVPGGDSMTGMLLVLTVMALFGAFAAAAAAQGAPEPVKYVCNFAGPSDVAAFKVTGGKATWSSGTEDDVPVEGTALEPTKIAGGAMYISMEPLKSMALEYSASNGLPADWTGYEDFVMYFENGSEFLINLHLTVRDKSGREYLADNLWIMRSRNPIIVPLSEMRTASGEALDFARIDYVKIDILSKEKFGRDLWTYKWLLVKGGAPVVRPDARTMMINFAPLGAPPVPGARLITERTAYAPWRGIGWTAGAERLMGTNFKRPRVPHRVLGLRRGRG